MRHTHAGAIRPMAAFFFLAALLASGYAQDIMDTSKPLDESELFGGAGDLVTVIDTATASAGTIQLAEDTKKYPFFLLSGSASAGVDGGYTLLGASPTDAQSLFGAVNFNGFSLSLVPAKQAIINVSASGTFLPIGMSDLSTSAYVDVRPSELLRAYASISYRSNTTLDADSLVTKSDGLSIDELFVDTDVGRKLFFRLGKQRISWGVGNWFKPADVLSLAAIDPDNPSASRNGPFAFKADIPFGLNHATLYIVPPIEGDIGQFSIAQKTDVVLGGFEVSAGGFYRSDLLAKPRMMTMFTGSLGGFDLYGEGVAAWGSDRLYVRAADGGGYETYRVEDQPVFQATLGAKYSFSTSDGLSVSLHAQGYYNGTGYQDASILRNPAAKAAIKATDGYTAADLSKSGAGMYYLAGNVSLSGRFGESSDMVNTSLSAYALANFSDSSTRVKPTFTLSLGGDGVGLNLNLSALASFGAVGSEYAPSGNAVTPALSATVAQALTLRASAPMVFGDDFVLDKMGLDFSLLWNVLDFDL